MEHLFPSAETNEELNRAWKLRINLDEVVTRLRDFIDERVQGVSPADAVRGHMRQNMKHLPVEHIHAIEDILEDLPNDQNSDPEAVARVTAERMYTYFTTHFSPEQFDALQREAAAAESGHIRLNEVLSYEVSGSVVNIHLLTARDLGMRIRNEVLSGLRELARQMTMNPELQHIGMVSAISWIVAKNPKLLERLGFTIDGPVSDDVREANFHGVTRPIAVAHMDRADFLRQYGGEESLPEALL